MLIDQKKCIGCGNCIAICPMGAIYIGPDKKAQVNLVDCVECYTCDRMLRKASLPYWLLREGRRFRRFFDARYEIPPDLCTKGAITPEELSWPRLVRRQFSDPTAAHPSTGGTGRGTEEMKTNEITGRVKDGEVGIAVEMGRPSMGVYFRDLDKVARALAQDGIRFEVKNPVTALMSNPETGEMRADILNEKVMSGILEFKVPMEEAAAMLRKVEELTKDADTVVSVGAATPNDAEGNNRLEGILEEEGYVLCRGKTNLGLGRRSQE